MTESPHAEGPSWRRYVLPAAVLAIGVPAGIAVVMAMARAPESTGSTFKAVDGGVVHFKRTAQPRWEPVATMSGARSADAAFQIAKGALQWKATWDCQSGRFQADGGGLHADSSCPRKGSQTGVGGGRHTVRVTAGAPWRIVVEQQVDSALMEPPLEGMTAATQIARGRLYSIQRRAEGRVALYRLPSGRLAVRFEHFYTTGSPGLELWVSRARNPRSTLDARDAAHTNAGRLRSTLGTYNQLLPTDITPEDAASIIIWCPTVTIAFGAASLQAR